MRAGVYDGSAIRTEGRPVEVALTRALAHILLLTKLADQHTGECMAKTVRLKSGRVFETLARAKQHFSDLREATDVGAYLPEPDRSDAIDLYERYCRATNWQAVPVENIAAVWDNRKRPSGGFAQTKALATVSQTGDISVFSIDKALVAVAE